MSRRASSGSTASRPDHAGEPLRAGTPANARQRSGRRNRWRRRCLSSRRCWTRPRSRARSRCRRRSSCSARTASAISPSGHARRARSKKDYGFVVTFDDITELVVAQRTSAWADVARRIAHEIKNPLTPIQLSAERIRRTLRRSDHRRPRGVSTAAPTRSSAPCRRYPAHGR